MVRNNVPLVVEERRFEEQTVQELQEQNKNLTKENKKFRLLSLFRRKKNGELEKELEEQRNHASKMDDLAWEMFREKERLERELKKEKDDKEKVQLELDKEKREKKDIQKELNKEQSWWDKWIDSPYHHQDKNSPIIPYASSNVNVDDYVFWQIGFSRLRGGLSGDEISEQIFETQDKLGKNNHLNRNKQTVQKARQLVKCLYEYWKNK